MKCDLSNAWKKVLAEKQRADKEAARKNAMHEAEQLHIAEKKRLEAEGWQFLIGSFTHPHNNDTWLETTFRSPRMSYHRSYYGTDVDFRKEEAKAIASSYTPRFVPITRELIEAQLADYFYENPQATEAPKINIQIGDDQGNKVSCVVG